MTGFLFYLIVDEWNSLRAMSLNFFIGKIQIKSVFSPAKTKKENYDFQGIGPTLWFSVNKWYWKLCILDNQNPCVKYLFTLIFTSWGENKNLKISTAILFSPSFQCLAFTVKPTKIFENIKGFGWVTTEWLKLSGKNFKDLKGMQPCYINIFLAVPSYPRHWHHNCI